MARLLKAVVNLTRQCLPVVIVVDIYVTVNNRRLLRVVIGKKEWILFALLSSYEIFRTAVGDINLLSCLCYCPI